MNVQLRNADHGCVGGFLKRKQARLIFWPGPTAKLDPLDSQWVGEAGDG
jgi:hypothetical protein